MSNLKNGIELLVTLQLALELMDEYKLKGRAKNTANMFKSALEKDVMDNYHRVYKQDAEILINSLNFKNQMIEDIASLSEADSILLSDFIHKFIENIEEVREKKILIFDKLI
jgi:hypoxanthine phosphoribosyltransferase